MGAGHLCLAPFFFAVASRLGMPQYTPKAKVGNGKPVSISFQNIVVANIDSNDYFFVLKTPKYADVHVDAAFKASIITTKYFFGA